MIARVDNVNPGDHTQYLFPHAHCKLCQRADSHARRPHLLVRLLTIYKARSRDIQVRPLRITHEMLQDFGSRHRTRAASSRLLDIRHLALDLLPMLLIHRHGPELLASAFTGSDNLISELGIVTEHSRHRV